MNELNALLSDDSVSLPSSPEFIPQPDTSDSDSACFEPPVSNYVPTVLDYKYPSLTSQKTFASKKKRSLVSEILQRPLGTPCNRLSAKNFQDRWYGSMHTVQRLEMMCKLTLHSGCVNSVSFNQQGNLLVSSSDDLTVVIWNWAHAEVKRDVTTKHSQNVLHAKFLPFPGHIKIATCGLDGRVTVIDVDQSGTSHTSKKIFKHRKSSHRLALVPGSPHCFFSCGEDSQVVLMDIRQDGNFPSIQVTSNRRKIRLYSIECHPLDPHEFAVGGENNKVRIYDFRNPRRPLWKLFRETDQYVREHVSSVAYSYNGGELMASYLSGIYLWDCTNLREKEPVHRYIGHRNLSTIKSVLFFGPRSEYVVSGSDCGHIYIWGKESETVVQWIAGDEIGVVNSFDAHPSAPVLASSGLDEDVKIWVPSSDKNPNFHGLAKIMASNVHKSNPRRLNAGNF